MERFGLRGRTWFVFTGLATLVILFLMLAAQVRNFHGIDEKILLLMREPGDPDNAIGTPRFEEFVRDISALGSQGALFLGIFAASGFLVLRRQYHAAILLIVAVVGAYSVAAGLKESFDRPRPSLVTPFSRHTGTRSFPSGHSVMAAAVYLTMGTLLSRLVKPMAHKIYFIAMAALLAFLVGVSRIYLGMHHTTDVVSGWIIGVYWAGFCWEVTTMMRSARGRMRYSSGDRSRRNSPSFMISTGPSPETCTMSPGTALRMMSGSRSQRPASSSPSRKGLLETMKTPLAQLWQVLPVRSSTSRTGARKSSLSTAQEAAGNSRARCRPAAWPRCGWFRPRRPPQRPRRHCGLPDTPAPRCGAAAWVPFKPRSRPERKLRSMEAVEIGMEVFQGTAVVTDPYFD